MSTHIPQIKVELYDDPPSPSPAEHPTSATTKSPAKPTRKRKRPQRHPEPADTGADPPKPTPKRHRKAASRPASPGSSDTTRNKRTGGGGKRWTGDELVALLDAIVAKGTPASTFDGVLATRTRHQCDTTFRNNVLPLLRKTLLESGGKGGGSGSAGGGPRAAASKSRDFGSALGVGGDGDERG